MLISFSTHSQPELIIQQLPVRECRKEPSKGAVIHPRPSLTSLGSAQ